MDPLKQDNEPLFTTLKLVIRLFFDPKKVIAEVDGAEGSVVASEKLCPVATQVHDFLLSVYHNEYDNCFKCVPLDQHMREAFATCAESEKQSSKSDGAHFFKPLRESVTALQRSAATMAVVTAREGSEKKDPGDEKKRSLARNESEVSVGGEADLRSDLQNKCAHERKKWVQFTTVTNLTKPLLDEAYQKSGVRQCQTGKGSHRAFFFSADLHVEHATEPWLRPQFPSDEVVRGVTSTFKEMKGSCDWLFLFDGRGREVATDLGTKMHPRPHQQEMILLYTANSSRSDAARTRKVALSASSIERLLVYPPCAKTALVAKPRVHFNALGESSTHDTTSVSYTHLTLPTSDLV